MEQQRIYLLLSLLANMAYFIVLLFPMRSGFPWMKRLKTAAPYFGGAVLWATQSLTLHCFGLLRVDALTLGLMAAATLLNAAAIRRAAGKLFPKDVSHRSRMAYRQLSVAIAMGVVFSAVYASIFLFGADLRSVDWLLFANGVGYAVAFSFLTMRLVRQLRIDQAERKKSGFGFIVFLAFLISHAFLGCSLTFVEAFGFAENYDFYILEFLTLLLMTMTSVITGERQFVAKQEQLERKNEQLEHIAYHDSLTGLKNRMFITEYLEERIRTGEPCFVMLIDLDRFKQVNDWLGHQAGDVLLLKTAERLREAMGEGDVLGRLGGDEFLVVGAGGTLEAAVSTAERILRSVPKPIDYEGHSLLVTPSVGIAHVPTHATTAGEAMKRADLAMYRAKEKGRDAYHVFSEALDAFDFEDHRMKQELKGALHGSDLELYYQPRLDLRTGRVAGFEALLRWNRENGPIRPEKFITLAEQNGAIVGLGEWAMREACRQIRAWNEKYGVKLRVAVNVSFEQLRKDDFVDKVRTILIESGLEGKLLELEMTESAAMRDEERTRKQLGELRRLGVRIGTDDFGTGYSAFAYMKRLAVDRLKIDKSFVEGLPHSAEDQAIVKAMLSMARELRLRTTAEGVERADQLRFLASIGCEEIQGYYYSEPLGRDAADQWLDRIRSEPNG
ncbi:EAL domain-containing protein [Paenibacillus sp.]|uniref:putative bifunctional diguanylate cyclase/phosphodiesterase n=1 Tax=Paenibacillus sp. TaxID=58172 RepID=UPI002810E065|nr:EAL domain-containing protein [Paenibacillus sp.]